MLEIPLTWMGGVSGGTLYFAFSDTIGLKNGRFRSGDFGMLANLRLVNFKAFADQTLTLLPLTLLTGVNGTGKSSVIQALLLLRKAAPASMSYPFSFDLGDLGVFKDILFAGASESTVRMEATTLDETFTQSWLLSAGNVPVTASVRTKSNEASEWIRSALWSNEGFFYLKAERVGPRMETKVLQSLTLSPTGENAADFLDKIGMDQVAVAELLHPETRSTRVIDQVEAWMGEVSPGTRIKIDTFSKSNAVQIAYSFERQRLQPRYFKPIHVGFGISYALPVVAALVAAGSLIGSVDANGFHAWERMVIVENPEAHLHPRGQVKMGELMARAAASGVQVIAETHSDHVLNGVRIAVKEGILKPELTAIHFFSRPEDDGENPLSAKVVSPQIDADGRIDTWPEGFFDESENSLSKLL